VVLGYLGGSELRADWGAQKLPRPVGGFVHRNFAAVPRRIIPRPAASSFADNGCAFLRASAPTNHLYAHLCESFPAPDHRSKPAHKAERSEPLCPASVKERDDVHRDLGRPASFAKPQRPCVLPFYRLFAFCLHSIRLPLSTRATRPPPEFSVWRDGPDGCGPCPPQALIRASPSRCGMRARSPYLASTTAGCRPKRTVFFFLSSACVRTNVFRAGWERRVRLHRNIWRFRADRVGGRRAPGPSPTRANHQSQCRLRAQHSALHE